jgi:DNA uptake protein ComE-like DNA-binding protein
MNIYLARLIGFIFALVLTSTLTFATDMNLPSKLTEKAATATKGKVGFLDINSASESELKAIPGVGDTYAKKIIAGRPYTKKDQLKSKKIIPDSLYEKIKDKIVAKQPKK